MKCPPAFSHMQAQAPRGCLTVKWPLSVGAAQRFGPNSCTASTTSRFLLTGICRRTRLTAKSHSNMKYMIWGFLVAGFFCLLAGVLPSRAPCRTRQPQGWTGAGSCAHTTGQLCEQQISSAVLWNHTLTTHRTYTVMQNIFLPSVQLIQSQRK